ncbi:unnamed protein product, partial [Choristocarpus tenellus]
ILQDPSRAGNFRCTSLCPTLGGNDCPVLTATAPIRTIENLWQRPAIVIMSRVHPGESNGSYVCQGFLRFITGQHPVAQKLRSWFVIKVIPMLNPDGVINGNHRSSLAGCDLNRQWSSPDPHLHPVIYAAKAMVRKAVKERGVPIVVDIHAHR